MRTRWGGSPLRLEAAELWTGGARVARLAYHDWRKRKGVWWPGRIEFDGGADRGTLALDFTDVRFDHVPPDAAFEPPVAPEATVVDLGALVVPAARRGHALSARRALLAGAALAAVLAGMLGGSRGLAAGAGARPARSRPQGRCGTRARRSPRRAVRRSSAAPLKPAPGTLEYRVPRLLRIEFTGAVPTNVLVRGDTAWIEQPRAGQVIRTSARASGAPPLPFLEESVAVIERAYVRARDRARRRSCSSRGRPAARCAPSS